MAGQGARIYEQGTFHIVQSTIMTLVHAEMHVTPFALICRSLNIADTLSRGLFSMWTLL